MKADCKLVSFRALMLTTILMFSGFVLAGCKSKTQQANNEQAGGQPGAGAQSPQNNAPPSQYNQPPSQNAQQAAGGSNYAPSYGAPANGSAPAPQAPPPPQMVDLSSGTRIRVSLDQDLGSKISQPGDSFSATVSDDVVVNGQTVIPGGSRAEGTVIDAKALGRFKGGALLEVRLERVHTNWGSYPVATSSIERVEKGKGKRTGLFAVGGGGLGALIGGLAGGGKGALIGGLAGAGAGTATSAFTGNREIFLPQGTLLTFRLERSVHITEQ